MPIVTLELYSPFTRWASCVRFYKSQLKLSFFWQDLSEVTVPRVGFHLTNVSSITILIVFIWNCLFKCLLLGYMFLEGTNSIIMSPASSFESGIQKMFNEYLLNDWINVRQLRKYQDFILPFNKSKNVSSGSTPVLSYYLLCCLFVSSEENSL